MVCYKEIFFRFMSEVYHEILFVEKTITFIVQYWNESALPHQEHVNFFLVPPEKLYFMT
jgi:hypothetical protein